jgi:NADPH:quinone reductase-like Zn-dependent oxidoreductase
VRAALLQELGSVPVLATVTDPVRGSDQALVRVTAAPLNPLDLLVASGRFYAGPPRIPYVPGVEGVGEVIEGARLEPGQRIWFECRAGYAGPGSLAELTCADESTAILIEEDVADPLAASLGVAGLAGWLSVAWRAVLRPGERVLVLGATGAVGQIAVQAAKLLGAGTVVAAARNRESLERIRDLGADAIVELTSDEPGKLAAAFREAAGGNLDVTIDPLWGIPALAAALASGPLARLVHLGESAATELVLPSAVVRARMLSVLGYSNTLVTPREVLAQAYQRMLRHAAAGELRVQYEIVPLDGVAEAWRAQRSSPHRKLVITP